MNFGEAIERLSAGEKVSRAGWNGKGMYIFLKRGVTDHFTLETDGMIDGLSSSLFDRSSVEETVLPVMCMKTATGSVLHGWLASQTDVLASDWGVV